MNINFSDVKKLIAIAQNANISELEVMDGAKTIRITTRHSNFDTTDKSLTVPTLSSHISAITTLPAVANNPATLTTEAKPSQSTPKTTDIKPIVSPMVGTFFRSAEPNAQPLVEVGQTVTVNQTLCIIEAMKIMHEVKADKAGTIRDILVTEGDMVEYDQPLFVLD